MRTLILRERSRPSEHLRPFAASILSFALGHSLSMMAILFLASVLLFSGDQLKLALATVASFFGVAITQMASSILRGDGQIINDAGFQVGSRTLSAIVISLSVWFGIHAPWQIISIWAAAGLIYLIPFKDLWKRPKLVGLKEIYWAAYPFLILDLAITVYIRSDMLLLSYFGVNTKLIGQYAAAFRICEAVILLAGPVGLMVFRHLRLKYQPLKEVRRQLVFLLIGAVGFGIAIVGLVGGFAGPIINLLYGDKYSESEVFLQILALMLFFVIPNMILNQAALAVEKERATMYVVILVAVANVMVNALLIPLYGIIVAVWSTVLTEALVCSLMAIVLFCTLTQKKVTDL